MSSEFFEVVTSIIWENYTAIIDDSVVFDDKWDSNHNLQTSMFFFRVIIGSILILWTLLTLFSNALVLIAFFTRRSLRCYFNFYIIGITIADFVLGFFSMPILSLEFLYGYWPIGQNMCITFIFVAGMFMQASILAVVIISLDRYLSLAKPLEHYGSRSLNRALKFMSFAYAIPIIVWFAYLYWCIIIIRQLPEGSCAQSIIGFPWMTLSGSLIICWIPLFLILVLNLKSFCLIIKQRRRISAQRNENIGLQSVNHQGAPNNSISNTSRRSGPELISTRKQRERRSLRTLCFLVAVFAICWIPCAVLIVWRTLCFTCIPLGIYEVSTL